MIKISALEKKQIAEVAKIHKKVLSDGFVSTLSENFLNKFYLALTESPDIFTLVATRNKKILGFVSCTTNVKKLPFFLIRNLWKDIILEMLKNPSVILKFIESIFYPSFNDSAVSCEALSIAVINTERGQGIGKNLILNAKSEFKRRKFAEFQLSVRSTMLNANNFYQKIGLSKIKTAKFLGEEINFWKGKC